MSVFYYMFAILGIAMMINQKRNKVNIVFLCFLVLWLIQALRAVGVGCDPYYTYVPHFKELGEVSLSQIFITDDKYKFEHGYQVYVRIIRFITNNANAFLAITSFIVLVSISYIYNKYSKFIAFSFLLFASLIIYHFTFSGLRQSIAIALTFISTIFVYKRQLTKFICLVLIAFVFHKSAIIFMPVYFLYNLRLSKLYIALSVVVLISFFTFANFISEYTRLIFFGEDKYAGYLGQNTGAYGLTILYLLMTIFILVFSDFNDKKQNFLCWMAIATILLQPLGLVSDTADRIGYYFLIYFTLSIPNTIGNLKYRSRLPIYIFAYVLSIMFFFYCNAGGYLDVIPYHFIWEI